LIDPSKRRRSPTLTPNFEEKTLDKDRIKGSAEQVLTKESDHARNRIVAARRSRRRDYLPLSVPRNLIEGTPPCREWFGSQRQMLEGIRLSPEERAARKDASIERFFKSTPEQREQLKKNKSLS
jgi:hypothetical protein